MITTKSTTVTSVSLSQKIKDIAVFAKLRLSFLVVTSAVLTYSLAAPTFNLTGLVWLCIGGFLITGASNGFNQIMEKDYDALMKRTENRPIPSGRMSVNEAFIYALLMAIPGSLILWYQLNPLTGVLGIFSMFTYTAIYTPMKRISPISVFIGAFPGAIPPMLGYVAATGHFGFVPGMLFFLQFVWQFPHFWAIAWKANDDYTKAGYKMLPAGGKTKTTALYTMLTAVALLPVSLVLVFYGTAGWIAGAICIVLSVWFGYLGIKFYRTLSDKDATKLMFASFVYLPVILIAYLIDKL